MRKVLMIIDGLHFSNGVFEFIKKLYESQPFLLIGLFLPSVEYSELLYSFGGMSGAIFYPEINVAVDEDINSNISLFESLCAKNNIEFRIHCNSISHIMTEIKKESRYADLMLLSSQLFYANLGKERQHEYLLHVLHQTECPVFLIPEKSQVPETLVITYDGSAESTFAIKQFSYLFPHWTELNTLMVYASTENNIPDVEYIEELVSRHFANLTIYKLDAEPKKYFDTWLTDNKNPMVVAGAYSRSFISELLNKSFVDEVVADHNVPVFISHGNLLK